MPSYTTLARRGVIRSLAMVRGCSLCRRTDGVTKYRHLHPTRGVSPIQLVGTADGMAEAIRAALQSRVVCDECCPDAEAAEKLRPASYPPPDLMPGLPILATEEDT